MTKVLTSLLKRAVRAAGYEIKEHGLDVTGLFPVSQDPQLRVIEFDCVAVNAAFRCPA